MCCSTRFENVYTQSIFLNGAFCVDIDVIRPIKIKFSTSQCLFICNMRNISGEEYAYVYLKHLRTNSPYYILCNMLMSHDSLCMSPKHSCYTNETCMYVTVMHACYIRMYVTCMHSVSSWHNILSNAVYGMYINAVCNA